MTRNVEPRPACARGPHPYVEKDYTERPSNENVAAALEAIE